MKKYVSWLGFLPIALVTLILTEEQDTNTYAGKICISLLMSLFIFGLLYFMLLYMKMKKWVAISISFILWIIAIVIKRKFLYN